MSLWADTGKASAFGAGGKGAAHLDAVERLKDWTRERFGLVDEDIVLVSEIARALPGSPPLETSVAFWTGGGTRHHFTVFKPAEEVREDDVPPAWLKEALAASRGVDCDCC
jgi:nitrate reductase delta subunit